MGMVTKQSYFLKSQLVVTEGLGQGCLPDSALPSWRAGGEPFQSRIPPGFPVERDLHPEGHTRGVLVLPLPNTKFSPVPRSHLCQRTALVPKYEVFQIVLVCLGPRHIYVSGLLYTSLDFSCGLALGRGGSEQL